MQEDAHGNRIVCRGDSPRNGYTIRYRGSYKRCCAMREAA